MAVKLLSSRADHPLFPRTFLVMLSIRNSSRTPKGANIIGCEPRLSTERRLTVIDATGGSSELIADYVSTPVRKGSVNTSNANCSNYIMPDVKVQSLVGETLTLAGCLEPL
jgi:hypothetical protein